MRSASWTSASPPYEKMLTSPLSAGWPVIDTLGNRFIQLFHCEQRRNLGAHDTTRRRRQSQCRHTSIVRTFADQQHVTLAHREVNAVEFASQISQRLRHDCLPTRGFVFDQSFEALCGLARFYKILWHRTTFRYVQSYSPRSGRKLGSHQTAPCSARVYSSSDVVPTCPQNSWGCAT